MKAEHRHELKTNELAQWIQNLPEWSQKNLRTIIYISIIIVLVAASWIWHRYQKNVVSIQQQTELTSLLNQILQSKMFIIQSQAQGTDVSYRLLQIADGFQSFAQSTKNNQMAALALIKKAEVLRMELHYRLGTTGEQETATQLEKAQASYIEALNKASGNPSLKAEAQFGLGLCEEERGNYEEAKKIYREIIANSSYEGSSAIEQSKIRLNTMADYQQKVVFLSPSKPKPTDFLQPQIRIQPVDSNQVSR